MKSDVGSFRVHCIVEYIRQFRDFPFDVLDVSENLDGILFFYGFGVELGRYERWLLRRELCKLAEACEFAEAGRLVFREEVLDLERWL